MALTASRKVQIPSLRRLGMGLRLGFLSRGDPGALFKRVVHRAFIRDRKKLLPRRLIEIAIQPDHALEMIDPRVLPFRALLAVVDVPLAVPDENLNALERELLEIRVEAQGHRCACPKRSREEIVGAGPCIRAALGLGFVNVKPMLPDAHILLKLAVPRLPDRDDARLDSGPHRRAPAESVM